MGYSAALQTKILACAQVGSSDVARLCKLNFALGQALATAALDVIASTTLTPTEIDLIGSHGQTLWHEPLGPAASTLQIGEGAVIAEQTGITTINNFRTRDMAANGQGAPLTGYTDYLLFSHPSKTRTCQNIGGIANLTYLPSIGSSELPFAFDTGPGNMLLDDAVRRITGGGQTFDLDGKMAARGEIDRDLLVSWLKNEPFYHQPPPKTTGRELFGKDYNSRLWNQAQGRGLPPEDFLATLTALTAHSITNAYHNFLPTFPDDVIISGGGTKNKTLMKMLAEGLKAAKLRTSDDLGLKSAAKEALAFAVLAYETWHNRPGNLPSATGAKHPVVLGSITPGRNYRGLAKHE
jgi:anhydro-N-acetylmuramic acid kinase